MKKLKLDLQGLNAEVLTRSQLKRILGGDGGSGGDCTLSGCYNDSDCGGKKICKTISCTYNDGTAGSYNMCAPDPNS